MTPSQIRSALGMGSTLIPRPAPGHYRKRLNGELRQALCASWDALPPSQRCLKTLSEQTGVGLTTCWKVLSQCGRIRVKHRHKPGREAKRQIELRGSKSKKPALRPRA